LDLALARLGHGHIERRIRNLAINPPEWVELTGIDANRLEARIHLPGSRWRDGSLEIVIWRSESDNILVAEKVRGRQLPAYCPERHIVGDRGQFCLELPEHIRLTDVALSATHWWFLLKQFIHLQSYADKTGRWPPDRAYDHGAAAKVQKLQLEIAAATGLAEEFSRFEFGLDSIFSNPRYGLVSRVGVLNQNNQNCYCSDCNCTQMQNAECENRQLVEAIVELQPKREQRLRDYWKVEQDKGKTCCGFSKNCRLRIAR
jgi:hypothetical protein